MTKKRVKIVPAILVSNKAGFVRQWKKVAPYFSYAQIDIMDGEFVSSKTSITPDSIETLTRNHKLEIHLMVDGVSKYMTRWAKLKNVKKIIWHYEANKDEQRILAINRYLKTKGIQTGLAINPNTSLAKIKNLIPHFHTIQFMAIKPGGQGRKFQPKILAKIKALRHKYPKLNIAVDGGVNEKNIKAITRAGANIVGVGSYLQKAPNVKQAIAKLK